MKNNRSKRAPWVLMAVAMISAILATNTPSVGAQADPPTPLDLESLNPVPLNTWGVSGVGNTLSKQLLQVWDFAEVGDRLFKRQIVHGNHRVCGGVYLSLYGRKRRDSCRDVNLGFVRERGPPARTIDPHLG